MNGPACRDERWYSARATNSLPVPVSPPTQHAQAIAAGGQALERGEQLAHGGAAPVQLVEAIDRRQRDLDVVGAEQAKGRLPGAEHGLRGQPDLAHAHLADVDAVGAVEVAEQQAARG